MVNERRWLATILILYFLLGVGYSLLMPIWEAPDEPTHYHLAWWLARTGAYATEAANYEASQPRAFYYLGSYLIRALDAIDPKLSDYFLPGNKKYVYVFAGRQFDWNDGNYRFLLGVYALRWLNLSFGALALWMNWKTFRWIAPDKPALRLSALALAALTPQYLHIMSSVNNDALGALAGAFLFYLAILAGQRTAIWLDALVILLAFLLPLATKLTVLPVSAAALIPIVWKWFTAVRQKRWLLMSGVLMLPAAVLLYLIVPELFPSAASEIQWRLFTFHKDAWTWNYIAHVSYRIMASYWGYVGWLAVELPEMAMYLLTSLGVSGAVIHGLNLIIARASRSQGKRWVITFMVAACTLLAVARNGLTTRATQGRLLFPAIGALSLLMVGGWYDLLPERIQQKLPLVILFFMFALNIWLWVFGIIPLYYQPFLD